MLKLRLCTDRKVNRDRMMRELCERAKSAQTGNILIVPEQFSHTTERLLCEFGGDRIGRYAEVLSFSRLANRVFSIEGGIADTQTDASGRLLMMSLAVEQVQSRLKIYGNCVNKPEFLLQLIDTFEEFRSYCITPERLRSAAEHLTGVLSVKAEEFSLLMESYDAVCTNLGQNPQSKLTRLLDTLETSDYADGKSFWFDGFTDFNGMEQEILAELLHHGADLTVLLQCDGIERGAQQFDAARDTVKALLRIASMQGIQTDICTVSVANDEQPLPFLRQHLFYGTDVSYKEEQEAIRFLHGADREEECRNAAMEILRIVSQGARWRDISVACADFASYRPILESVFRHNGIPAYFAGDTEILRQPVVHMLLSALDAAAGNLEQDEVLSYIKSGFAPLEREQCDLLENYVLMWNISGSRWSKEWKMNPNGFRKKADQRSNEVLTVLNESRERVITPLCRFRELLHGAKNTAQMVLALYEFMQAISLDVQLTSFAEKSQSDGERQQAQEFVQVYGLIVDLLEQIFGVLGQSVRSPEEFARIFRTALSQCSVGTIPASLDCISVGSLMSQRRCDTDYVFLIGAQEGCFPTGRVSRSLLTDSERLDLKGLGLNVAPTTAGNLDRELAAIDSVLNAPEKRLYFSAVIGSEAYLLRRAMKMFPNSMLRPDTTVCRSEREYLAYLSSQNKKCDIDELSFKTEKLSQAKAYTCSNLSEKAVTALYGKTLRLSSSKIDSLASCRFAYFLQYGLRAQERETAQVDPSLYGTFVHDVLEHTAGQVKEEGGFHTVSLERVLAIAEQRMEEYVREELADLWESARAEYLFRRNFPEVRTVVTELYRELSKSSFEPQWFELEFADGGTLPAVRIVGEKAVAYLEGFVDRADIWCSGDKLYVRIIDYKTGKKSFDFSKVLNGIGLQMLLYLFALRKTGEQLLSVKPEAAGVLYFPARVERISVPDKMDTKKTAQKRSQSKIRSGLILDSDDVLWAMEACEGTPEYMPYSFDKEMNRKGNLFNEEQLNQLENFVFRTVAQLSDALYSGDIQANPYFFTNDNNACQWCQYASVCRESRQNRWLKKVRSSEEFWQAVKEAETDG